MQQGRVYEIRQWSEADPAYFYRQYWCELSTLTVAQAIEAIYGQFKHALPPSWHCCVTYRPEGVPADYQPAAVGDEPEGWQ